MNRFIYFIIPALFTICSQKVHAQHVIKNSLYFNSLLQSSPGNSIAIRFPVMYDLGYEQFINSRISLSLTAGLSVFNNFSSDYIGNNIFSQTEVTYGKVFNLTYETKYFFNESDGYYAEGKYLASSLTCRFIDEEINGSLGKLNTRITCFPYTLKFGTRSASEYMGLFADYYVGIGFNVATLTKRGRYEGYASQLAKPAAIPITLGLTIGYAF